MPFAGGEAAVVAHEKHDRVVLQPMRLQAIEHLADGEILPVLNNTITDPNKLAEQFVMILPLKSPISIK